MILFKADTENEISQQKQKYPEKKKSENELWLLFDSNAFEYIH